MNGQKVFFCEGMKLEGILYGGNEGSKRPGVDPEKIGLYGFFKSA